MQQFLLTTAKRKFIRGWYDIEEVLNQLSEKVTTEKNRQAIFTTIDKSIDNVLELEKTNIVIAVRDQNEQLSHYQLLTTSNAAPAISLMVNHPLITHFHSDKVLQFLEECDPQSRAFLLSHGYKEGKRCLIIAFHSPELLEGLVILGERSNQSAFDANDLRFFRRLANYMSAIFYRLTPMEKLQKSYFENVQRLHEAEIQLIRAQKIESIVHATRQCHHEIRTPLNIIRMGLGRVRDLESLKAYKSMVDEEIAHALEIVDETLLITDVEKPAANREGVFNLNDAIRRSLKLIQEDRYKVQASLEGDIPIKGIFSDIQVVFANLIHNASDAMPDGGAFTIQSKISDNLAVVEFTDTGKGIAEELRERVWEPYFSGHATHVGNSTAGRGWGLTIVNRIISEHKGTINFTSVVGEGTTFVIKLPLFAAATGNPALQTWRDN
jgi:signal transduction histidine kinase